METEISLSLCWFEGTLICIAESVRVGWNRLSRDRYTESVPTDLRERECELKNMVSLFSGELELLGITGLNYVSFFSSIPCLHTQVFLLLAAVLLASVRLVRGVNKAESHHVTCPLSLTRFVQYFFAVCFSLLLPPLSLSSHPLVCLSLTLPLHHWFVVLFTSLLSVSHSPCLLSPLPPT